MCGILGICLDKRDRSEADFINIKADFSNLLEASMVRGIDATGFYIVNRDADIVYLKAPKSADEFVWENGADNVFWDTLDAFIGPDTVAIIGHTRAATTGSPECNDNNHPVVDAPIIGVHNGVIRNHLALAEKYPKAAEVDSAAIFSMLKAKAGDKPLTVKTITKSYDELEGPAAIAVADMRKPDGVFLARHTNPVNITRDRDAGVLMFASTLDILKDALGENTTALPMPDDTVCRIDHDAINGKLQFVPVKKAKSSVGTMVKRHDEAVRKAKASAAASIQFNRDVDAGERCPKCRQLYLVVYMGNQEQKCCSCNPYGESAAQEAAPKPSNTTKTAAKRPTSAGKRYIGGRPRVREGQHQCDAPNCTLPQCNPIYSDCDRCADYASGKSQVKCLSAQGRKCPHHGKTECHSFDHPLVRKMRIVPTGGKSKAPAYKTTKSGKLKKV